MLDVRHGQTSINIYTSHIFNQKSPLRWSVFPPKKLKNHGAKTSNFWVLDIFFHFSEVKQPPHLGNAEIGQFHLSLAVVKDIPEEKQRNNDNMETHKNYPPVIFEFRKKWRLQLASYTLREIHHPPEITGPQYDWLFLQVAMVLSSSKSLVDFWNRCCNRVEISIDDQCWAKDLWFDISVQHLLPWLHSDADLHPFECVAEFPKWWCHVACGIPIFKPYPWI